MEDIQIAAELARNASPLFGRRKSFAPDDLSGAMRGMVRAWLRHQAPIDAECRWKASSPLRGEHRLLARRGVEPRTALLAIGLRLYGRAHALALGLDRSQHGVTLVESATVLAPPAERGLPARSFGWANQCGTGVVERGFCLGLRAYRLLATRPMGSSAMWKATIVQLDAAGEPPLLAGAVDELLAAPLPRELKAGEQRADLIEGATVTVVRSKQYHSMQEAFTAFVTEAPMSELTVVGGVVPGGRFPAS